MAKLNGYTKWIGLALTIAATWTAIVLAYGKQNATDDLIRADVTTTSQAVTKLEKDGCKPSQTHTTQIAVIEPRLEGIEKQQGAILKQGDVILAEIKKRP